MRGTIDDKTVWIDVRCGNTEKSVKIDRFEELLVENIGSVTWTMTKKQLKDKVRTGIARTIRDIANAQK